MQITNIGIIGCGNVSGVYFQNANLFKNIQPVACADLDMERARAQARKYGLPKALTVDQILADPDVEIIVNLTIPRVHAEVAIAALEAGKHVYSEKPLATNRLEAAKMFSVAAAKNLRVGCAPDTFLGGGHQTCRHIIDSGEIGEPVAATGFMLCPGHESWHPNPAFYYKPGGGPMLDMGPYYLTALVNMIGGITRVSASARATFAERTCTSDARRGEKITVETPTHISATLDFAGGAIGTLVTSFDVVAHTHSAIEVYGTEGSMLVPDPNGFSGKVKVRRRNESEWREVALTHGHAGNGRGIGVADMASAIREGRPHRASGALANHVLDVMISTLDSSESSTAVRLTNVVDRPAALPAGLADDEID